jgi:tricarballylate dehydrogenase
VLRHHVYRWRVITNSEDEVLRRDGTVIPGLYVAGEITGGIFYHNYPSGAGLMLGAVFGRRAGTGAATFARHASGYHLRYRR